MDEHSTMWRRRPPLSGRPTTKTTSALLAAVALAVTACGHDSSGFERVELESVPTISVPATTAAGSETGPLGTPVTTTIVPEPTAGSRPASPPTLPPGTSVGPTSTTLPPLAAGTAPRIRWNGEERYVVGANLPWVNFGCDFGCGADGGGASSDEGRLIATSALQRAHDAGIDVVRWWLFPGPPRQFTIDEQTGLATGLDLRVFQDIDAALELADAYDVSFIFTLFSAPSELPESWLMTEEGRLRLVAVLGQLFEQYRDDPRIMTWQVINEPEWDIWERGIDADAVRELVRMVADEVHVSSNALVSVASARLDGLVYWTDLGLDYLTVHWYDPMVEPDRCAICVTYGDIAAALGIDVPVLVGEFYAGADVDPDERWNQWYDRGYAGAVAWSLLPDRTGDRLPIDLDAVRRFTEQHSSD